MGPLHAIAPLGFRTARYHGGLFGILIGVIVLIVYGSLYPWTFQPHPLPASPLYLLLHTWELDTSSRRFWADIPVNIGIYIPLGMSAYLAFRRSRSRLLALAGPVVLGAVLSASMEMLQLYVPGRHCSTLDLVNNILGSELGVLAGIAFVAITGLPVRGPHFHVRDRVAVILLFCWVAFLLFPLFPSFSIPGLRDKIVVFIHSRPIAPGLLILLAAEWIAASRLLVAAGTRAPLAWLLGLFALVPAQFLIVNHFPSPSDVEAPLVAIVLFLLFGRARWADCAAGIFLLAVVAVRGLAPFRFGPAQPFQWIPFSGVLLAPWQTSVSTLLEKVFQYGASLWLLSRSLFGLVGATAVVAITLAAVEILQTRLSGHVPEITDPLLAILLGLSFSVLRKRPPAQEDSRSL